MTGDRVVYPVILTVKAIDLIKAGAAPPKVIHTSARGAHDEP